MELDTIPYKPILCVDFDGVLHSYDGNWKGADVVNGSPVPGAIDFLLKAMELFSVHIFSARSHQEGGIAAMRAWLYTHWSKNNEDLEAFEAVAWPNVKPPALVYLDDRAICFTGTFPSPVTLRAFKPWNRKDIT